MLIVLFSLLLVITLDVEKLSYFDLRVKTITVVKIPITMTASRTPQMIAV